MDRTNLPGAGRLSPTAVLLLGFAVALPSVVIALLLGLALALLLSGEAEANCNVTLFRSPPCIMARGHLLADQTDDLPAERRGHRRSWGGGATPDGSESANQRDGAPIGDHPVR